MPVHLKMIFDESGKNSKLYEKGLKLIVCYGCILRKKSCDIVSGDVEGYCDQA